MTVFIGLFTLLSLVAWSRCNGELFSATTDMARALELGNQVAADLKAYLAIEQKRLGRIRQLADRLTTDAVDPVDRLRTEESIAGNPINAYLATRRLSSNWRSELVRLMDARRLDAQPEEADDRLSAELEIMGAIKARVEETASLLPADSDVDGAADALLRLQQTYRLPVEKLANGHVTDEITSPTLTAAQCFHIGQKAYEKGEYLIAEGWFREAYNKVVDAMHGQHLAGNRSASNNGGVDPFNLQAEYESQPSLVQVMDHLSYALGRQGRYAEALDVTRLMLKQADDEPRIKENEKFYVERIAQGEGIVGPAPPPDSLSKFDQETEAYEATCRGESVVAPPPDRHFYCRYHVPHPYYLIGPLKEEVLFPDPRIVMWYDMISPDETQKIIDLATPRLRRATVKNPVTGVLETAFYRTSKSAWLPNNLDEITNRINQRIHRVTGLSMNTAEDLQVGNYGIGGHYAPHFDFGRKREKDAFERENGNRIATIIFYLTDVSAGGATAFNRIGARVAPKRGAASFWYNLFPSGEGDLRTRHAACPVIAGSKWVMNVWFHERGQEFIRPCELERGPVEVDDGS